MLEVERAGDLAQHVGTELGPSGWVTIDQNTIDAFAEATGDHQWIHVDVARARREAPGGTTIAHGYLTLSLLPRLAADLYCVRNRSRAINYGSNKVRFTGTVSAGARVRLRATLKQVETVAGGVRLTFGATVEVEGQSRPALVAETLTLFYD